MKIILLALPNFEFQSTTQRQLCTDLAIHAASVCHVPVETISVVEMFPADIAKLCAENFISSQPVSSADEKIDVIINSSDVNDWLKYLKESNAEVFNGPASLQSTKLAVSLYEKNIAGNLVGSSFGKRKMDKATRTKFEFLFKEIFFNPKETDFGIIRCLEVNPYADQALIGDVIKILKHLK